MSKTILVVEDEGDLRELIVFNLTREGFEVVQASDGDAALQAACSHMPDLILLDVMMPGPDGFEVSRRLKKNTATDSIPIIMLTARGEEMDRVVGLELGADDYVVKPFSVRELILRVKAVLRRFDAPAAHAAYEQITLRIGKLELNPQAHKVLHDGENIVLTATEFRLLEDLMRHSGTVRKREQLLDSVWGYTFEGYGRTVDTHVRRLRAKLGGAADFIETIRGVGYRFRENG